VLVSQARMRMIEGQLRTIMDVDAAGMGGFVGHVEPTWLDRLVSMRSSNAYPRLNVLSAGECAWDIARLLRGPPCPFVSVLATVKLTKPLQQSPSSTHPPLQLRLQNPREAGFLLKTVPVRTNHEIWSVLRVSRFYH
jgi:hypothetical protein